ncbi:hypothetical protein L211DRAFT_851113 [Terfezia boudieri ATCC MYA-4762]|uniref:DEAD/DEAH box helicase domain-containing protein n=1 Tax=Terfezia boudieri ATCC MYA-4762 TaxID=1051890 RepID=A0A3N4LGN7_9PEZI|nr:hypothetical protein L211DRAFT_851113 [Terfezia boudieri ATCC MYA-4762]
MEYSSTSALDNSPTGEASTDVVPTGRSSMWSQYFQDVTPPRSRDIKLREMCEIVSTVLRTTATARNIPLQERDWQVEASSWLLLGYDVSVIAATSNGKSFCYQLLALVALGRCVIVMSPLMALIADR